MLRSPSRSFTSVVTGVIGLEVLMALFILFHLGGMTWQFAQLAGALVGGTIALISINLPLSRTMVEATEPLLDRERLAWTLIGCGLIAWGLGESIWRYYLYILHNPNPFPSYADLGYSALPLLIFAGILLQPSSDSDHSKLLIVFDSLISMGAMLAIGWYVLLGNLALHSPVEDPLAKFLGLYYPTTDVALLSSVAILLLRSRGPLYQATARRISLSVIGIGLCFFATSDFAFNVLQNAGTYVEGTWVDLGWPLGLMTIGLAAYLRRFLPVTSQNTIEQRLQRTERIAFGPECYVPYIFLSILFVILVLNAFSSDPNQRDIRPILLLSTIVVVSLVVVRQILTLLANARLTRRQAEALEHLEEANRRIEDQARMIAERNAALEMGIAHLKDVQASLANGNLRARAKLTSGELLPLAASLNLMADRLMRLERTDNYSRHLARALAELSMAIERYRLGGPFIMPVSCNDFPEINRLLLAMGMKEKVDLVYTEHSPAPPNANTFTQPTSGPASPGSQTPFRSHYQTRNLQANRPERQQPRPTSTPPPPSSSS